jgi:hypothetical protein
MPDGREKGLYSRQISECNEAGDEEAVDVMSYVYGVRVAQPQSELQVRSWSCTATIGVACAELEMGVLLHYEDAGSSETNYPKHLEIVDIVTDISDDLHHHCRCQSVLNQ